MMQVSNLLSCSTSPAGTIFDLYSYNVKATLLAEIATKANSYDCYRRATDLIKYDFIGLHEYKEGIWE